MNIKLIVALMLASVLCVARADEPNDQLKNQIQKVEKRADGLEKSIKQAQDSTSELKKQFGELTASGKIQQQMLTE